MRLVCVCVCLFCTAFSVLHSFRGASESAHSFAPCSSSLFPLLPHETTSMVVVCTVPVSGMREREIQKRLPIEQQGNDERQQALARARTVRVARCRGIERGLCFALLCFARPLPCQAPVAHVRRRMLYSYANQAYHHFYSNSTVLFQIYLISHAMLVRSIRRTFQ